MGRVSSGILLLAVCALAFTLASCGGTSTGANSALLKANRPSAADYTQVNLVSNGYVAAKVTDPNLVNGWGIANGPTTPIWVANQGTSTSSVYSIDNIENGGKTPSAVIHVVTAGSGMQGPTGIVYNPGQSSGDFPISATDGTVPSIYIFANLNGTLSGWNPKSTGAKVSTVIAAETQGYMYKGLALGMINGEWYLYAADATPMGGIKVFDSNFKEVSGSPLVSSPFTDPDLPTITQNPNAVWTTFNVENVGGNIFVTYAPIPPGGGHPIFASDAGVVAEFTPTGSFMRNVAVSSYGSGPLDDPWGIVMAPGKFGKYSDALLVGNFGNGEILAYRPNSGGTYTFEGTLDGTNGKPIMDGRLWDLSFGNGADGADPNTLYLATGGPNPKDDGLFASIAPAEPAQP